MCMVVVFSGPVIYCVKLIVEILKVLDNYTYIEISLNVPNYTLHNYAILNFSKIQSQKLVYFILLYCT